MRAHRGLNLELVVGERGDGRAREQGGNQDKLVHGANSGSKGMKERWNMTPEGWSSTSAAVLVMIT